MFQNVINLVNQKNLWYWPYGRKY